MIRQDQFFGGTTDKLSKALGLKLTRHSRAGGNPAGSCDDSRLRGSDYKKWRCPTSKLAAGVFELDLLDQLFDRAVRIDSARDRSNPFNGITVL